MFADIARFYALAFMTWKKLKLMRTSFSDFFVRFPSLS